MPLHTDLRPDSLEKIYGNTSIVESLKAIFSREHDFPHAYLFVGPSGSGKTTFAGIIANLLKCHPDCYYEFDATDTRGIDFIRSLKEGSSYAPSMGKVKVHLIDECFHEETNILTEQGTKKIKDIKIGDKIRNILGTDEVKNVFINKVVLERIIVLHLSNGKEIVTTKEHLFFTSNGWKKAIDLSVNDFLLDNICNTVLNTNLLRESKYESMLHVFKRVQKEETRTALLFQKLFIDKKSKGQKSRYLRNTKMRMVQKRIQLQNFLHECQKILFPEMCFPLQVTTSSCSADVSLSRALSTFEHSKKESSRRSKTTTFGSFFKTNERKQSFKESFECGESKNYKEVKGNSSYLERGKGRKWQINNCSNLIGYFLGLGNRSSRFNKMSKARSYLPTLLQNRYRKQTFDDWYRSEWQRSQDKEKTSHGCKERNEIKRIRVDNIEVYKRGNYEQSAFSFISDKEKNQGFVKFYDLEITNHPSYFVENVLVHNCHQLTQAAQEDLLKLLEKAKSHCYYVLCTTEQHKLKDTLIRRCATYETSLLTSYEMEAFLKDVLKKEGISDFPKSVLQAISLASEGSPGKALIRLDQVIDITDEKTALEAAKNFIPPDLKELNAIFQILLQDNSEQRWEQIRKTVSKISEEPEKVRRGAMGYFEKVLLNSKKNHRAAALLSCFSEPTYSSGKAGLTLMFYNAAYQK